MKKAKNNGVVLPQSEQKPVRNLYARSAVIMTIVYIIATAICVIVIFSVSAHMPDYDSNFESYIIALSKISITGTFFTKIMLMSGFSVIVFAFTGFYKSALLERGRGLSLFCIIIGFFEVFGAVFIAIATIR